MSRGGQTDAIPIDPPGSPTYIKIPNYADFIIYRSTQEGHVSWRNRHEGSRFCQVRKIMKQIWE